jgi:glycosyltransferase involved in cell wall biosynthesis
MSSAPNGGMAEGKRRVAFILKGYPRLSETFIAQEIEALEQRGLDILIVSLRRPTDKHRHPVHARIRAPLLYLPEYLYQEPLRVLRAWWRTRRTPGYAMARAVWRADLQREPLGNIANRGRRFGQALVLANELPADIGHLHSHFLHTPASVTRYAAMLRGLAWTGSAHAKDIWTTPDWELREKLASCEWLVTCTASNRDHLAALAPDGRVDLVYHGLDLAHFLQQPLPERPARAGQGDADAVVILSVGRLVEKKGTDVLLAALSRLPTALHWRLVHVGGGPLRPELERQAQALGIAGRVSWRGAMAQPELIAEYRAADLFALASRIGGDGDRDGLPNVLMEAQSQGLPCVATRVSAIPELIEDGKTGVLVPSEDADALALSLAALIGDPSRRKALGAAGRARVAAEFGLDHHIDRLAAKFGMLAPVHAVAKSASVPS